MIRDIRDPNPPYGRVYNADTGEQIKHVFRFNEETGDYWHYATDSKGKFLFGSDGCVVKEHGRCRLRFVPFETTERAEINAHERKKLAALCRQASTALYSLSGGSKHELITDLVQAAIELEPSGQQETTPNVLGSNVVAQQGDKPTLCGADVLKFARDIEEYALPTGTERSCKMRVTTPDGNEELPVTVKCCLPWTEGMRFGRLIANGDKRPLLSVGMRVQIHIETDGMSEGFLAIVDKYLGDGVHTFRSEGTPPGAVSEVAESPEEEKKIEFRKWL